MNSLVAKAIMKKCEGDEVSIETPDGALNY